jgi:hypothetical protein
MPAVSSLLLATAIGVGAAGTAMSISQSNSAQKDAKKAAADQMSKQSQLEADLKAQQSKEDSTATRDAAKKRQRQMAAGATGRNDTILTSPLGATGQTAGAAKTLLGQ